ncbi:hypothetical protein [uncultured Helicobacter sp.]|uniref:hypothetical protein n=1 Tax=uncultured Helicobacter sp. TaxID=175537 RepID=UPI0026278F10|nr:hypothetical protein [uncultured Helicobacter sp.]
MLGRILSENIISGNDGHRYNFEVSEIRNLEGRAVQSIIENEVDFEIQEDKAVNIYLIKKQFSLSKESLLAEDIPSIKMKAFLMYGCYVLSGIPIIGQILGIIGFVLNILIVIALKKISGSQTLLKNFVIGMIAMVFSMVSIIFSIVGGLLLASYTDNASFGIFGIVFSLVVLLVCAYYGYLYHKELAQITNQPFFLYSFYLTMVGLATSFFYIGFLFLIGAIVLQVLAWIKFEEVKKSPNAL